MQVKLNWKRHQPSKRTKKKKTYACMTSTGTLFRRKGPFILDRNDIRVHEVSSCSLECIWSDLYSIIHSKGVISESNEHDCILPSTTCVSVPARLSVELEILLSVRVRCIPV